MLVDEDDADILPCLGERLEGALDGRRFGFVVHDEEVLLSLGAGCDVLHMSRVSPESFNHLVRRHCCSYTNAGEEEACYGVLG